MLSRNALPHGFLIDGAAPGPSSAGRGLEAAPHPAPPRAHEPAVAPRVLFLVRNRRGLGHMMRGLNIARALLTIQPDAQVRFHLRSTPGAGLWPADIDHVVDDGSPDSLPEAVRRFAPDIVVFDTMLPAPAELDAIRAAAPGVGTTYVMRRCLEDEQAAVYAHPALARMACVIVPHTEEEFGHPVPATLNPRCHFVGPIVRRPDPKVHGALAQRLDLQAGELLITSTVGGGGFDLQAQAFFDAVAHLHTSLIDRYGPPGAVRAWRHIVVLGPHFGGTMAHQPGLTVVETEPQLVDLLALSSLVVAEGGYNTVSELCEAGTPAVFLPSVRGKDDQFERVQRLVDAGCAASADARRPAQVARTVVDLLDDPSRLATMRQALRAQHRPSGNEAAARALLALAASLTRPATGACPTGDAHGSDAAARSVLRDWLARTTADAAVLRCDVLQAGPPCATVHRLQLSAPVVIDMPEPLRAGLLACPAPTGADPDETTRTDTFITKSAPADLGAAQCERTRLIGLLARRHARLLRVPPVLGWWPVPGLGLQAGAAGQCLANLASPPFAPALMPAGTPLPPAPPAALALSLAVAVRLTGAAIAEIHGLPACLLEPEDMVDEPRVADGAAPLGAALDGHIDDLMRPRPQDLACHCPSLAREIGIVTDRLHAVLDPLLAAPGAPRAWLHRDLHPRQVFVAPVRVEVIDWDLADWGDPALDLANLQLHLRWRWPREASELQDELARGYGAGWTAVAPRLPAWRAFHLLRRACKAWRLAHGEAPRPADGHPPPRPHPAVEDRIRALLEAALAELRTPAHGATLHRT